MWDHSAVELFYKGGECMYPLLLCSILGLAVILERLIVYLWIGESYRAFVLQYGPLLRAGRVGDAQKLLVAQRGPLSRTALAYLDNLNLSAGARAELVAREGSEQVSRLETRLSWLAMIGHVAPLLGLLGTVTGLVAAFHAIELKAGQVQPGDLASGIWEALITTVFGLVIAIPCLVAYHFLDNRAGATALQLQWLTAHLNEWLAREPAAPTKDAEQRPTPHEPAVEVNVASS